MRTFPDLAEFAKAKGETFGPSPWYPVTQDLVDQFAHAVGDTQWLHCDPERAAATRYGGTIVHGYMTLGMLPAMMRTLFEIPGVDMGTNIGLDKVRFPHPIPVGSLVRAEGKLTSAKVSSAGCLFGMRMTVEVDGGPKAACVADTLSLIGAGPRVKAAEEA